MELTREQIEKIAEKVIKEHRKVKQMNQGKSETSVWYESGAISGILQLLEIINDDEMINNFI